MNKKLSLALFVILFSISNLFAAIKIVNRTGVVRIARPDGKVIGVARLAEKIAEALEQDPVRTLKDLAPLLPKDVFIETSTGRAETMSDDELAALIASKMAEQAKYHLFE